MKKIVCIMLMALVGSLVATQAFATGGTLFVQQSPHVVVQNHVFTPRSVQFFAPQSAHVQQRVVVQNVHPQAFVQQQRVVVQNVHPQAFVQQQVVVQNAHAQKVVVQNVKRQKQVVNVRNGIFGSRTRVSVR